MNKKPLKHYLRLVYPIVTLKKGDEWLVWHTEFGRSAIMGYGKTRNAAIRMLHKERRFFIQHLYERDVPIPEPESDLFEQYSGQFVLRIPKALHAQLATEARADRVSLNQHLVHLLSERNVLHRVTKTLEHIFSSLTDDSAQFIRGHHMAWGLRSAQSADNLEFSGDSERTNRARGHIELFKPQPTDNTEQVFAKAG